MKDQSKKKRFAKLFSQYLPSSAVFKCGLALLIICTVAAFVMAYYHDAYSSILELKELAATDVWFKLFVILMVLGAALLVGSPLLAMLLAGITLLLPHKEPDGVEDTPSTEESAPMTEQQAQVAIDDARLRGILDSDFMHEWTSDLSKTHLDQVIEDLQIVRNNFKKGAKQDTEHYTVNNIIEIAYLLDNRKFMKKRFKTFPAWCCALFESLQILPPKKENIKNNPVISDHVKRRFYYLLKKE